MSAVSSNNSGLVVKFDGNGQNQIERLARFANDLDGNKSNFREIQSINVNFTYQSTGSSFSKKIFDAVDGSKNPRPDYGGEVRILASRLIEESPAIWKKANDSGKIINEMGRLFKFLNENKVQMGFSRIYEINVMLRHPAITDKAEVFAAIANNLAEAKDEADYGNRVCNLNDVTPPFMNKVLEAERAAGASINRCWPDSYADSTQHPFAVTSKK